MTEEYGIYEVTWLSKHGEVIPYSGDEVIAKSEGDAMDMAYNNYYDCNDYYFCGDAEASYIRDATEEEVKEHLREGGK